jgi:hypothetical protein|nr:MAG TPA: hypothetical protein [Caudoviricetes sp.]
MAKILTPNKDYSGISASVPFINGVGYTDDEDLISWFEEHDYGVEVENTEVENTEVENKPKGKSKPKSSAKAGDESKDESDDPGENKPE